ncbi:hypothetical protein [Streptomyces agglomeratus]|nr:hypothetical protein [Streptomyces agglomeratus]
MGQERVQKTHRSSDKGRATRETEQDSKERPEVRKDVWERWFKER